MKTRRSTVGGRSVSPSAVSPYAAGASTPRTAARAWVRPTPLKGDWSCSNEDDHTPCLMTRALPRRTTAAASPGAKSATSESSAMVRGMSASERGAPSAPSSRPLAPARRAIPTRLVAP